MWTYTQAPGVPMTMEKPWTVPENWPQGHSKMALPEADMAKVLYLFGPRATEVAIKTIVIVMAMRPLFTPLRSVAPQNLVIFLGIRRLVLPQWQQHIGMYYFIYIKGIQGDLKNVSHRFWLISHV